MFTGLKEHSIPMSFHTLPKNLKDLKNWENMERNPSDNINNTKFNLLEKNNVVWI
jgi:hypothetical protein